jgi:competence protein ComEC
MFIVAQIARGVPGWGAELIGGLAIRNTSAVSPELDSAMKTSSLTCNE